MKRPIWIALLAAITFVVIVIARMPAAWVLPTSVAQASCASIDGSLWSGSCSGLTLSGTSLGDVTWELHPLRLFVGRLAAHVTPQARARMKVIHCGVDLPAWPFEPAGRDPELIVAVGTHSTLTEFLDSFAKTFA